MNRHTGCVSLLTLLTLGTTTARAAEHYVCAGATGSGSSWTDACPDFTGACAVAALVRGDTYYVADGNYGGRTFDTPVNGSQLITIKKATVSSHGTDTGWADTSGDGQAVFDGPINFLTDYWLFDGQVGGGPGSWTTGHGFKIVTTTIDPGVFLGDNSWSPIGNITVSHFEVQGNFNSSGGGAVAQDGVAIHEGVGVNTFRYFYLHDLGRCPFLISGSDTFLAEYGYTGAYTATGPQHSEVMSTNEIRGLLTFRYNLVAHVDNESTGGLLIDTAAGGSADIYGNVFARPAGDAWAGSNGILGGWTGGNGEQLRRVTVVNNSFVNINNPGSGTYSSQELFMTNINVSSDNTVQNNLLYNVADPGGGGGDPWQTISHNHFISTSAIGTNATTGTDNPFVDLDGLDFRLKETTPAGITLPPPYDVDMFGTVRGADGVWDRGAIEFGTGDREPPAAPTNLQVR
jgi:hypothetical protein